MYAGFLVVGKGYGSLLVAVGVLIVVTVPGALVGVALAEVEFAPEALLLLLLLLLWLPLA